MAGMGCHLGQVRSSKEQKEERLEAFLSGLVCPPWFTFEALCLCVDMHMGEDGGPKGSRPLCSDEQTCSIPGDIPSS